MFKIIKNIFLFLSFAILIVSFSNKLATSKIHVVVLPFYINGQLEVNNLKCKIKGNTYAEFEITGDSIRCSLNIKAPLAYKNPPVLNLKSNDEIYINIYEKKINLMTVQVGMDTIEKALYYELKAKSKKQIYPSED